MQSKIRIYKGFVQVYALGIIIISILILAGGYFSIKQYQNNQSIQKEREKVSKQLQQQKDLEVEKLKHEVEELKNNKPSVITQTIIKENPSREIEILAKEINQYITGVVKISCGNVTGSGTLRKSSVNRYLVLTNHHVIDKLFTGVSCFVVVEDIDGNGLGLFTVDSIVSAWNDLTDVALLDLKNLDKKIDNITMLSIGDLNYKISSLRNCSEFMSVGSPVVIIGYPSYSEQSLTVDGISMGKKPSRIVANGIISGYVATDLHSGLPYKDYFISAKIDSGNSGGIAFSKDENGLCNLGIPTWLTVGNYETQGIVQNFWNVSFQK